MHPNQVQAPTVNAQASRRRNCLVLRTRTRRISPVEKQQILTRRCGFFDKLSDIINYRGGDRTALEELRPKGIVHVVHEYANFVSSADMVEHGWDIDHKLFKAPINTHVSHAFYLNCRKLADFFQKRQGRYKRDIMAEDYVPGFSAPLPVYAEWRDPINRQLAHVTYDRITKPKEIKKEARKAIYEELKHTWREFRKGLVGSPYEAEFKEQVSLRKEKNGQPTEFGSYDLD